MDNFRHGVTAGMEKQHDFDVKEMTVKLCNTNLNPQFKDFSPAVAKLCAQIIESPKHVDIFSRHFSGNSPTPGADYDVSRTDIPTPSGADISAHYITASVYTRKGLICGELQAECKVLVRECM